MEEKRSCPICGEEFLTKRPDKIYCSSICAKKGHYLKQKERREKTEGICPVCGEKFQRDGTTKCCSKNCEQILRGKTERTCGVCGKKFFPTHQHIAFCSDECRKKKKYPRSEPKTETRKKPGTSISEIVKEATARGMTYGKYVEALEKGIL